MATKPRQHSESGCYHVFQRGVNHFDIFEDDHDRRFYLKRLVRYAAEFNVEIHAWCLMSNHTHLLLRSGPKELSALMQKLGSVYARRFNTRHERTGPLFEGRFGSVCIETEAQFMSTMRYIHRNPAYHDDRVSVEQYEWSSYSEYKSATPVVCELGIGLELFGSVEAFVQHHAASEERSFDCKSHLDLGVARRMSDDEARRRINMLLEDEGFDMSASHIGSLPIDQRNQALVRINRLIGCSMRQIQRITAIAFSSIRAAVGSVSDGGEMGDSEKASSLMIADATATSDGFSFKNARLPSWSGTSNVANVYQHTVSG